MLSLSLQFSAEQIVAILGAICLFPPFAFHIHAKWKGRKDKRGADDDAAL